MMQLLRATGFDSDGSTSLYKCTEILTFHWNKTIKTSTDLYSGTHVTRSSRGMIAITFAFLRDFFFSREKVDI